MGRCKCISKPCKRCLFAHADSFADEYAQRTIEKYTMKYMRKGGTADVFERNLRDALNDERGLAHSKAREYWFRRGPRLFCTAVIAVILNILCVEVFKGGKDRLYSIVYGAFLLLLGCYMLYERLPDAVAAGMLRIGHDHYTCWKSTQV